MSSMTIAVTNIVLGSPGSLAAFYAVGAILAVWGAMRGRAPVDDNKADNTWSAVGKQSLGWAVVFVLLGLLSITGRPPGLPEFAKDAIDFVLTPLTLTLFWGTGLSCVLIFRRWFVRTEFLLHAGAFSWLWLGLSLTDPQFAAVATDADNIPIVAFLYILGGLLWLALRQAVENDQRIEKGLPPNEAEDAKTRYFVWPDLVVIEAIAVVAVCIVLLAWSLAVAAPLESPAHPTVTPNPARAPWYFVGLQELLVYFDPGIAGVVYPLLILFGLAAIPYLDVEPTGGGYYSFKQRQRGIWIFLFGFLQLWILLIVVGLFFRGPNWAFYGPYEERDSYKIESTENVSLSEMAWGDDEAESSGALRSLLRESPGLFLLGLYFIGTPFLLKRRVLRSYYEAAGRARYAVLTFLLLAMAAIPIKMILCWTLHMSYIVDLSEWSLRL
jgi:hypothetical protein